MRNFKKHTIIIRPDQSKSYQSTRDAIKDCGFEYYGEYEHWNPHFSINTKKYVFERISDGRLFAFASSDHFCTTIYSIRMRELTEEGKKNLL